MTNATAIADQVIMRVDPDLVELNPENIRKDFSKTPELLAQIVAAGEIQQVCFLLDQTDKTDTIQPWMALEGNRRTLCAKLIKDRSLMTPEQLEASYDDFERRAGYAPVETDYTEFGNITIPAIAIPPEKANPLDLLLLQLFSGTGQKSLSLAEQADGLLKMKAILGTWVSVGKYTGRPQDVGTFSRIGSVYKSRRNEKIVQAIDEGRIDVIGASFLITFASKFKVEVEDLLARTLSCAASRGYVKASQALIKEVLNDIEEELLSAKEGAYEETPGETPGETPEETNSLTPSKGDSLALIREAIEVLNSVHSESPLEDPEELAAIARKSKSICDLFLKLTKTKETNPAPFLQ